MPEVDCLAALYELEPQLQAARAKIDHSSAWFKEKAATTRNVRSSSSKSSIKKPILLETVEEAIRRLIQPELSALKREKHVAKAADHLFRQPFGEENGAPRRAPRAFGERPVSTGQAATAQVSGAPGTPLPPAGPLKIARLDSPPIGTYVGPRLQQHPKVTRPSGKTWINPSFPSSPRRPLDRKEELDEMTTRTGDEKPKLRSLRKSK